MTKNVCENDYIIGIGLHSICNIRQCLVTDDRSKTDSDPGKLVDNDRTEDIMYYNNLPNASSPANCGFLVLSSNLFVNSPLLTSWDWSGLRTTVNIFYHRASLIESKQRAAES